MSSGGDARNSGKRGNVNVTCVRDNNNIKRFTII